MTLIVGINLTNDDLPKPNKLTARRWMSNATSTGSGEDPASRSFSPQM